MNSPETAVPVASRLLLVDPAPRIAVEVRGQGSLVLFLHGIGGNRSNWHEQAEALASRFTTAAWDARGYGDSDDYEGPLAFADFSSDLLRVLDRLQAPRAHLVGLSMGGRIALDFYGRHPQRVASLVFADCSGGMPAGPEREARIERFLRERREPLINGLTPGDIAPQVARGLVTPAVSPERLARVEASLAALHKESYLKTLDTVTRYDDFPAFSSIAVPSLVIVGEQDRIATPEYARWMAAQIPGGRFAALDGAGHLSNLERPEAFTAVLMDFLAACEARAA